MPHNLRSPLGRVPDDWILAKFKDVTRKIRTGATPKGGESVYLTVRQNYAFIRSQNVFDRYFDAGTLAFISDEHAEELRGATVERDDLLLNITGDGVTFGRSCLAPEGVLPACVNQHVALIRANPEMVVPGFLLAYLTHPSVKEYLESFNSGGSRRAITKGHIESFEIALPSLDEQERISNLLKVLDSKIDLNRRMNQTLEAIACVIFKSWFVDFDPVREGHPSFPCEFYMADSVEIPKGWDRVPLSEIVKVHNAKRIPLSSRERAERKGPYPYYGAASIVDYVDDYLFDGTFILLGEDGSVVQEDESPVLQYVWGKFWVNNHAHVLTSKGAVSLEHLYLSLAFTKVQPYVTGAVQPKLNQGNLLKVPFILPSDDVCELFADIVEPLFARIRSNVDESRTLAALRDTLLPKLLSGEIRVKQAEKMVGEAV